MDMDRDQRIHDKSDNSVVISEDEAMNSSEAGADNQLFPNIFITVGTTFYDDLITWAQDKETIDQFMKWETRSIRLQIGSSKLYFEGTQTIGNIFFEFYCYKPNLFDDYQWADLVISHAGAGTVLDVLDLEKTLFVIPNESLMDNHQMELGDFIHTQRYGYSTSLANSHSIMSLIRRRGLNKFPSRNIQGFCKAVEETMNFDPVELYKAKEKEIKPSIIGK